MLSSRTIEINGCSIHYLENEVAGPPLLFIPGGVVDHVNLTWKTVIRRLSAEYRIVAPDLPGFGASRGLPARPYTTEFVRDFVASFISRCGIDRPVLLVNSMSSAAVLEYVLAHPEQVRGLVLSGAYGWRDRVPLHRLAYVVTRSPRPDSILRALAHTPGVVTGGLRLLVKDAASLTPELIEDGRFGTAAPDALTAFAQWLRDEVQRDGVRSDLRPVLKDVRVPTFIIQGTDDWLAPAMDARRAAELVPGAEYLELDARHLVPRERTEDVVDAIVSFLRRRVYTD